MSEVATPSLFKICILLDMDMIMQSTVRDKSRERHMVGSTMLSLG